jgi:HD-like signal output (HDOD) protein
LASRSWTVRFALKVGRNLTFFPDVIGTKRNENYGKGEATIEYMDRQEVLEKLLATFGSPTYEPPVLPATALELLALSRSPKVDFDQIAALLQKDPLVAAKVLKVAQSAMYARGAALTSLRDAVVRLGLETVASIFLQVSMNMRVFRAPGYDRVMVALRRHSAMVANVARVVCRRSSVYDEYAFLCGLLHDVGIAAGAAVIGTSAPFDIAWPAIIDAHAEAGRSLCVAWKLPSDVALVVGMHHVTDSKLLHPVACAVVIAEWLSRRMGFGIDDDGSDAVPAREMEALNVGEATMREIFEEAKKIAVRIDAE